MAPPVFPTVPAHPFDEAARRLGFTGGAELIRMVAVADLSTPEKLAAYQAWQLNDGTKAGLAKLPTIEQRPVDQADGFAGDEPETGDPVA